MTPFAITRDGLLIAEGFVSSDRRQTHVYDLVTRGARLFPNLDAVIERYKGAEVEILKVVRPAQNDVSDP